MAKTPRYRQIAQHYRDRIVSGEMRAGSKFPTRRDMMSLHGTSRATADKVMEILHAEGMAVSTPRAGTVVADLSGHSASMNDRAATVRSTGKALAKDESSRILRAEMTPCPEDIAVHLGVEAGEPVLIRERVTSKSGVPAAVSRSFYRKEVAELAPELTVMESTGGSVELAAERMGSPKAEAVEYVTSRLCTEREMDLLDIGSLGLPVPVTQVARVVMLEDGRVVEAAVKVSAGERPVVFRTNLSG